MQATPRPVTGPASYRHAVKAAVAAAALFLTFTPLAAHGVLIGFDDIPYFPSGSEDPILDPPDFFDHPLSDEYAAKGLRIRGGYLNEYNASPDPVSQPNYLLGGNLLQLEFVGPLPLFVSMYVSSANRDAIFIRAYGRDQRLFSEVRTSGWFTPQESTPYVPNELVTFDLPSGISWITLHGYYNMRLGPKVDDLTYLFAVPEPPAVALLGLGLLGLAWRLRKRGNT